MVWQFFESLPATAGQVRLFKSTSTPPASWFEPTRQPLQHKSWQIVPLNRMYSWLHEAVAHMIIKAILYCLNRFQLCSAVPPHHTYFLSCILFFEKFLRSESWMTQALMAANFASSDYIPNTLGHSTRAWNTIIHNRYVWLGAATDLRCKCFCFKGTLLRDRFR